MALKSAVPVVSIKGSALRTVYRYNKLSLSSVAFVTVCDVLEPAASSNGLIYTWAANVAGVPETTLVSTSKQTSSYLISEYVLVSNVVYTNEVTVFDTASSSSTTTSTDVFVQPGELVVGFTFGGDSLGVRAGEPIVVNASLSYDLDLPNVVGLEAGLSYVWSCVQSLPTLSTTCPLTVDSASSDAEPYYSLVANVNGSTANG